MAYPLITFPEKTLAQHPLDLPNRQYVGTARVRHIRHVKVALCKHLLWERDERISNVAIILAMHYSKSLSFLPEAVSSQMNAQCHKCSMLFPLMLHAYAPWRRLHGETMLHLLSDLASLARLAQNLQGASWCKAVCY